MSLPCYGQNTVGGFVALFFGSAWRPEGTTTFEIFVEAWKTDVLTATMVKCLLEQAVSLMDKPIGETALQWITKDAIRHPAACAAWAMQRCIAAIFFCPGK